MELLIAFLLAFGTITEKDASVITTKDEAQTIITRNDLDKDYLIWEAEGDDF